MIDAEDSIVDTHAEDHQETDRRHHVDWHAQQPEDTIGGERGESGANEGEKSAEWIPIAQLENHEYENAANDDHANRRPAIPRIERDHDLFLVYVVGVIEPHYELKAALFFPVPDPVPEFSFAPGFPATGYFTQSGSGNGKGGGGPSTNR